MSFPVILVQVFWKKLEKETFTMFWNKNKNLSRFV